MKKVIIVGVLFLCFAVRQSQQAGNPSTAATNATTSSAPSTATSTKTTAGTPNPQHGAAVAGFTTGKTTTGGTSTQSTTKTTTPKNITCYKISCNNDGCLKNQTSTTGQNPTTCTGVNCQIKRATNGTSITIKADCAATCQDDASTYCCQQPNCNNDASKIKAPQSGVDVVSAKYFVLLLAQLYFLLMNS